MGGSKKLKRGPHNLFVSYAKGEVDFRKKYFKDVNDLFKFKEEWKCTMCSCSLEHSILKGVFSKHPALGVLVCHKCLEYYGDGLFSPDEEGEDKFCRWCAQGGELYCCSKCVCTFCKKCVRRHFKENRKVMKSLDSEDWKCFLCEPKPIWFLRALYWAVYNFRDDIMGQNSSSRDSTRSRSLNQSRAISNNENGASSSSDEETSLKNGRQHKRGQESKSGSSFNSKAKSENDEANSSDDESRKPDRSKQNRNGRLNDKNVNKSKNVDEDSSDDDDKLGKIKKKPLGPKSKREKSTVSLGASKSSEVNDNLNEGKTRRNLLGPKSRRKKETSEEEEATEEDTDKKSVRSTSKRESSHKKDKVNTSSDEEEKISPARHSKRFKEKQRNKSSKKDEETSDEEDVITTKKRAGPLSKTVNKEISEDENDEEKEDKKVKKTIIGPKSKKENIKKSSHQKEGPYSSSEEEKETSSNEKEKKTKIGPKSRIPKPSEGKDKRKRNILDEEEKISSDEEDTKVKKTIGPKSKKENTKKPSHKKESQPSSSDEEKKSSSKEKEKKVKIGPKSRVSKSNIGDEIKKKSSDEEEKIKETEKGKSKNLKPASKKENSSKKTSDETEEENESSSNRKHRRTKTKTSERSNRSQDLKRKETSDEEEVEKSLEPKSKKRKKNATKEETTDEEEDLKKKHKSNRKSEEEESKEGSESDSKTAPERAAEIFQETLDLSESLAMDIRKKTDKLKKLSSSSKFSSPGNTRKIFFLLFNEMKNNSNLFLHLAEVVENHIGNIDRVFDVKTNSIYEQTTMVEKDVTEKFDEDDVNTEEADTSDNTRAKKKKDEVKQSIAEKDIKKKKSNKRSEELKSVLTSDSDDKAVTNTKEDNSNVEEDNIKENDSNVGKDNINEGGSNDGEDNMNESAMDEEVHGVNSILTSDEEEVETAAKKSTTEKEIKNKKSNKRSEELKSILTSDSDEPVQQLEDSKMEQDEVDKSTEQTEITEPVLYCADILSSDISDTDVAAHNGNDSSTSSKQKKSDKKSNDEEHVDIKSILSSDSDNNIPDENETVALGKVLSTSDTDLNKTEPAHGESEYFSLKSESDIDSSVEKGNSTPKGKRRSSCKSSGNEAKSDDSKNDKHKKSKKNKRESTDENSSGDKSRTRSEKSKTNESRKDSIEHLTALSSLDKTPVQKSKSNSKKTEQSSSEKSPKSSSEKSSKTTPSNKKKREDKDKSLLEFLNEEDNSSAEELEESTELLSSLIKAKGEEAKKQNEEMIKQGLLRADDESNKEDSDSDIVLSDDSEKLSTSKSKVKKEKKESSSENEKEKKKSKRKDDKDSWKKDRLLTEKLSDTDTSEGEAKMKKKKKAEDTITLSSDEELFSKRKTKKESSDDSDCLVVKKKLATKRKARLRDSSDSSDVLLLSSSEDSDKASSESDFKKKPDKTKKRSRIKKMKDSDEEDNDSDDGDGELNASQGTPGKGRKNIRHILKNEELTLKTLTASKAEEDRKKRIEERQALYNKLFKIKDTSDETLTKLVLDFDEKSKTELISVHPELINKLKPHQVEGVRFMFNACFESVQQIKKNKAGSGCILAHCMGLGKTLQIVTLVHTLMTHKDLTKVNRVMVVTPLNTVSNWVDEFHNWLKKINNGDDCETFNLIKSKKDYERSYTLNNWFEEGGVLIIGYEMFRNLINKRGLSKKVKTTIQKTLLDPGPDLVVCDEGHILKNEASAVSKAMCQIKTLRRIILTGTPLQNNLEEYHCMVQFIKPNLLGDKKEFKNRFAHPINNGQYIDSTPRDVKIMKRRAHVLYKMLDGIVQRRDYNVLTPFLPPKYEYVISIKLTDLQIKLYSHYLATQAQETDGKHRLFADYQALKLVWTHPWTLNSASLSKRKRDDAKMSEDSEGSLKDFIDDDDDDDDEEEGEDSSGSSAGSKSSEAPAKKKPRVITRGARNRGEVSEEEKEEETTAGPSFWWTSLVSEEDIENITNSNKLLAFMFVLKQCEEIGDKLLVFSQSLETLSMLEYFLNKIDECSQDGTLDANLSQFQASWTLGSDYFRLDGSSSSEDRSYWVKTFNNPANLRARLFLISTKAGGLGINLVAANRVIIFDVSWNPSHDIQSIFRVFRFGQKKPCYIYRFLAQGTMEEKIYDRQVAKQSMSCRVVDEQQIDRHFTRSDISELYEFKPDEKKDRKTPALPKDRLMAEMIKEMDSKIVAFHEHDSLLENVQDEELNEEERKAAWEEFESEKSRPAMNAGLSYVNNLIMQNTMKQQQAGNIAPGGTANLSSLKLDNMHMLNYLKASNPDVSEGALQKIVEQNAQRLEDYKKRQEAQFQHMVLSMHQGMAQSYANQMMNKNLAGGVAGMNRLPGMAGMQGVAGMQGMGGIQGMGNMAGGQQAFMGRGVNRPTILRPRGPSAADIMRRMAPVVNNNPRSRPPQPRPTGPGSSSSTPIEIEL